MAATYDETEEAGHVSATEDDMHCGEYLKSPRVAGRAALTRLRTGTNELRIELGRHHGLQRDQRLCQLCDQRPVEDEQHFMLECPAYQVERGRMFCGVFMATSGATDVSDEERKSQRLHDLIGAGADIDVQMRRKCYDHVITCVMTALRKRALTLGLHQDRRGQHR